MSQKRIILISSKRKGIYIHLSRINFHFIFQKESDEAEHSWVPFHKSTVAVEVPATRSAAYRLPSYLFRFFSVFISLPLHYLSLFLIFTSSPATAGCSLCMCSSRLKTSKCFWNFKFDNNYSLVDCSLWNDFEGWIEFLLL